MAKKKTINIPMDDGLRNHLETMASVQSKIENRTVSMAEVCRKMLVAQSGYGVKRFCMETLTPLETELTYELDRLRSQPHYSMRLVPETQPSEPVSVYTSDDLGKTVTGLQLVDPDNPHYQR